MENSSNDNIDKEYLKDDYESTYEYGLSLFKESLKEVSVYPYHEILPYFNYPLSMIESDVKEARESKTDNNEFYKEQCDKLFLMYERLLNTSLICQFETGTKEEKQRAKEILKVIKKCIIKNEVSKQPENSSKKLVKNLFSKFKKQENTK